MQTALLIIALSVDVFFACVVCGMEKIEIGRKTALCISMVCSGVLFLSFMAGSLFGSMMKEHYVEILGFVGFFLIGIWKLTEYALRRYLRKHKSLHKCIKVTISQLNFILNIYNNPVMADKDHSKKMSVPEGVSFALAMSLDAVIAGVSAAGFLDVPMYLATVWNFFASLFAVIAGSLLGRTLSRRWNMDFSWIGGILFLILAFGKMV